MTAHRERVMKQGVSYDTRNPQAWFELLRETRKAVESIPGPWVTTIHFGNIVRGLGLPHGTQMYYAERMRAEHPELGQYIRKLVHKNRNPADASDPIRFWGSAVHFMLEDDGLKRLANYAEEAHAQGEEQWFKDAQETMTDVNRLLAPILKILIDPAYRREVSRG